MRQWRRQRHTRAALGSWLRLLGFVSWLCGSPHYGRTLPMLHSRLDTPSAWVERWAALIAPGGRVLDVASGAGRHARWLAARGYRVDALDRDAGALATLAEVPGVNARQA